MILADAILTAGSVGLTVGIVPLVRRPRHEAAPLSASGVTGVILAVFAVVYASLGLGFSAATTAMSSALWLVVAAKRVAYLRSTR